mgnify:CR=1 FL=1
MTADGQNSCRPLPIYAWCGRRVGGDPGVPQNTPRWPLVWGEEPSRSHDRDREGGYEPPKWKIGIDSGIRLRRSTICPTQTHSTLPKSRLLALAFGKFLEHTDALAAARSRFVADAALKSLSHRHNLAHVRPTAALGWRGVS